jgi:hypothetical protein
MELSFFGLSLVAVSDQEAKQQQLQQQETTR